MLQSLNYVDVNLKPRFLIKSGYYIVPSPSTALLEMRKTNTKIELIQENLLKACVLLMFDFFAIIK